MEKSEAFKIVYDELINSGSNLILGKYDAKNGNSSYMYGMSVILEWIAYEAGGCELGSEFDRMFFGNMLESERKARENDD